MISSETVCLLNALFPQGLSHAAVLDVSSACLRSVAATQSGWRHSAALCLRCWNVSQVVCRGVSSLV